MLVSMVWFSDTRNWMTKLLDQSDLYFYPQSLKSKMAATAKIYFGQLFFHIVHRIEMLESMIWFSDTRNQMDHHRCLQSIWGFCFAVQNMAVHFWNSCIVMCWNTEISCSDTWLMQVLPVELGETCYWCKYSFCTFFPDIFLQGQNFKVCFSESFGDLRYNMWP